MAGSLEVSVLLISAVAAGLMAGVYFAFSSFVMRSLDTLGDEAAALAMNAVNDVILRSWFLPLFFASTVLFALISVMAVFEWRAASSGYLLSAGLLYVGGMFVCTVLFNVPLNNRLKSAVEQGEDLTSVWPAYRQRWTRWNHVRTVCSTVSCTLICVVLGQAG